MNWQPDNRERTAAEIQAAWQPHVGSMPSLQYHEPGWAKSLRQLPGEVSAYLKQKRNNEIANNLLKLGGAPEELQGQGTEGLKGYRLWQQMQIDQEAAQPDTAMNDLQYQHLYQQTHPDEFPQSGKAMTPYQQEHLRIMQERENRISGKTQQPSTPYGLSNDEMNRPGYVTYWDADRKKQLPSDDPGLGQGFAEIPQKSGKSKMVPYQQYESSVKAYKEGLQPTPTQEQADKTDLGGAGTGKDSIPSQYLRPDSAVAPTPQDRGAGGPTLKQTPVQVQSIEEAKKLPPGTPFLDPNGVLRKR